ncbi:pyruvate dehydrogenase (acetyl-transferring) E1 component subunit alpha [Arthrobacter sp. Soil782]|uniref:pyruvate dehydrogenase (acetyl-transferring) E1 component subunit alpha n=1 Tax=Arthrobacter sp. Soil782 TaxID=1736410 RepID=UPI0006FFD461|nr:pyruvate dehydrogenase (acetyl-transferring) E1 component subunit alpha [Arthrobacter sp. Soil782]
MTISTGNSANNQFGESMKPTGRSSDQGPTAEEYMLPSAQPVQLVGPSGEHIHNDRYPLPDGEALLSAYEKLVVGRRINDQANALVRQGRMAVYPSSHGQEACQVAAAVVLEKDDWLFPTYRDTVAVITRGVDPLGVLTLLRGDWHSGYDPYEYKTATQATPLATQLLHAVGVAHAAKLRGENTVVLALCGDGATSEGDFHEALNFAAVFHVPVVFLVQNNEYAISVPLKHQTVAPSLAHKAIGYGMPGERVDGNDLAAMLSVLGKAVDRARDGGGPALVEAHTYRMQAHTNADDPSRYRAQSDVDEWVPKDPITRMRTYLGNLNLLTAEEEQRIAGAAEETASTLRDGLNSEPEINPADLFEYVYTEKTSQLREQAALLADELSREGA